MAFRRVSAQILILLSFLALWSCGNLLQTTSDSILQQQKPEASYCSSVVTPSTPITVTSTAYYYYRTTVPGSGLVGNPVAAPIPFAEVVVKSSDGTVVQCGQTNALGQISVQIQKTVGNYTLQVNSRADNSKIKVSVLSDITTNDYYSISTSFSIASGDASKAVSSFYAFARTTESAKMEGAAFNILANVYKANEYIRNTTGNNAWVASKVTAYWKTGFNPYSYFGSQYANTGVSFYSTGERKLYILGGISGNIKTQDTDHFDDSVILHEYAHFLEDVYAVQESPGGSHDGNYIIDPRLAWSEGWANFFQGAVLTNWNTSTHVYGVNANTSRGRYYIDTKGFGSDTTETGESTSVSIQFTLNENGRTASTDQVSAQGEGTFREVSISRELYKTVSDTTAAPVYGASVPFSAVWDVFTSSSNGFKNSAVNLRNIGLFNYYLDAKINADHPTLVSAWNNITSNEYQNVNTLDYANPVTSASSCAKYPISMSPVVDSSYFSTTRSNKFRSNDFYLYNHTGGTVTINLNYSQVSSPEIDLDLVIYKMSHTYYEKQLENQGAQASSYGVAVRSVRTYNVNESGVETVSLTGLAAGNYMINVVAYTYGKSTFQINGTANYNLKIIKNGAAEEFLCPEN